MLFPKNVIVIKQWKKEQASWCCTDDQYVNQLYNNQKWPNLFFFPLLAAELAMRVEYGLGGMKRVLLLDPCRMLTSLQFALINWKN